LFASPKHPYTQGLIATLPEIGRRVDTLPVIPGGVPDLARPFPGCRFADRCGQAGPECRESQPELRTIAPGHEVACFKAVA
jgi:oligopeptide/dipeptide ABC transporter ATP-binding protein